jgi:MFS family permease
MNTDLGGKRRIFYGWYIVAAGFACLWVNAGMGFYSFPVFFIELDETFGWGMGRTNAGISIAMVGSGLISPLAGALLPKWGSKKMIIGGALVMSLSFVMFSFMRTLWQFYLICFVLSAGWTATGTMPTSYSVSDWFEKKRGMATGIMMMGVGLGGLCMVPLTRLLIDRLQWQSVFMIYAVVTSALLIPVAAIIYKRRPAELGVLPDGRMPSPKDADGEGDSDESSDPPAHEWDMKSAIRTRTFWLISLVFIFVTFGQTGLLINQVKYFQEIGISPERAAFALGFCAMLGIAGKLFFGAMADRYPVRNAMALSFGLQAVGTVILIYTGAIGSPLLFVLVWGFSMGGVIALEPLIVAECFGMKSFGVILGMVYVATTVGAASGPPFAGIIFDLTGDYSNAFAVFVVTYALAAILSFLVVPPKAPQATG